MRDMRVFRVRNRAGQWAGAGMRWRTKGKAWLGTGPLRLALRNAFEDQARAANGYAHYLNAQQGRRWASETSEKQKQVVRDYVIAHGYREGWEVHMADFGSGTITVLTMKEFYEL